MKFVQDCLVVMLALVKYWIDYCSMLNQMSQVVKHQNYMEKKVNCDMNLQ